MEVCLIRAVLPIMQRCFRYCLADIPTLPSLYYSITTTHCVSCMNPAPATLLRFASTSTTLGKATWRFVCRRQTARRSFFRTTVAATVITLATLASQQQLPHLSREAVRHSTARSCPAKPFATLTTRQRMAPIRKLFLTRWEVIRAHCITGA